MSTDNSKNILDRLKAGDRKAMKELFHQHYKVVCSSIYRYVRNKETVEDIAQEVFIKLWQKKNQLNITGAIGPYIRRMAINEAISHLRKSKHYMEDIETADAEKGATEVEEKYLYKELNNNITDAINTLPPKCRAVFQLSRFEQLSYKEIAERLEISVKTVENQMGKALKVMRRELRSYLGVLLIAIISYSLIILTQFNEIIVV